MLLNKYQEIARKFQSKLHKYYQLNWAMGLAEESGEVIQLIRKEMYNFKPIDQAQIKSELGDVLWNLTALADYYNLTLEEIAAENINKLTHRHTEKK